MSDNPLQLENLVLSYGEKSVLDGINLTLKAGSVTGLLGRNGAGKTTLMRAALGLLRADSGSVSLFGVDAWNAAESARQRIGYVAQEGQTFSWLRIRDALKLVGSFYQQWDETLIKRYLVEWDVDAAEFIQDLSVGQRQKVSILMAMGHHPDLLVLDEPVASLDPVARRQFLQALVELNSEIGSTILFSTHITSDLERVASNVCVLHNGKLRFNGELDSLKEGCQRLHLKGEPLPEALDLSDITNYQQRGAQGTAFASNWDTARSADLATRLGIDVVGEPLPLEELFAELTHNE